MAFSNEDYRIHLNFLAVQDGVAPFHVFRRIVASQQEARPFENALSFKLPGITPEDEWAAYWISFDPIADFEPFEARADYNRNLTRHALYRALNVAAGSHLPASQIVHARNSFLDELSFVMATHDEGSELLVVQPYDLKIDRQLGFLIDFHFKLNNGAITESRG